MRITILIFIIVTFTKCVDSNRDKGKVNRTTNDTLRLIEVLSFNGTKNTSLVVKKDSLLFLTYESGINSELINFRKFYFDFSRRKFDFENILNLQPYSSLDREIWKSDSSVVKISSIAKPNIKYSTFPKNLGNESELDKIIKAETRTHIFNGDYFFIDQMIPQNITIYNTRTKKIASYNVAEKFREVTGFLLYDIDKDNNPEIGIFHIGNVPREDAV